MSFGFTAAGIAEAGLAISAVAAGVSAYGAVSSSIAQRQAAEYQSQVAANNAKIAGFNANSAIAEGNTKLQAAQQQEAQQMGSIRAAIGAGGVDLNSGSALREQQGLAQVQQLNNATIVSNAARSAWNYKNQGADYTAQASLDVEKGQQAQEAGIVGGFSSLLSGAGQFASGYTKAFPSATS
jgi:hypothetical protein